MYGMLTKCDYYSICTINYDRQGNVEKIRSVSYIPHKLEKEYNFHYDNNKVDMIVTSGYDKNQYKYTYDETGKLKSLEYRDLLFLYTTDENGNIVKINEYHGTTLTNIHICQYDKKGRKIYYKDLWSNTEIRWNYDSNGRLQSVIENNRCENTFDYNEGEDIPYRCIKYKIGDIKRISGSYRFDYEYSLYPTEEELKQQAERQRILDSIKQVEQKRLKIERKRLDSLKIVYSSCKCLFDNNSSFENCLKKNQEDMEQEIMQKIDCEISFNTNYLKTAKELRKPNNPFSNSILKICNLIKNLDNDIITTHAEDKLSEFIASYESLSRAYKRVLKREAKKPSEFLVEYIDNE
jgi:hypothetical protein